MVLRRSAGIAWAIQLERINFCAALMSPKDSPMTLGGRL